jgi:hypothetical protein
MEIRARAACLFGAGNNDASHPVILKRDLQGVIEVAQ